MMLLQKTTDVSIDKTTRKLTGYLSTYGVDRDGDEVVAGAFDEFVKSKKSLPMLAFHKTDRPIGVWTDFVIDAKGLRGTGELYTDVDHGESVSKLLERGAIDGLSLGFEITDFDRLPTGRSQIRKMAPVECSIVSIPSVDNARVMSIKQQNGGSAMDVNATDSIDQKLTALDKKITDTQDVLTKQILDLQLTKTNGRKTEKEWVKTSETTAQFSIDWRDDPFITKDYLTQEGVAGSPVGTGQPWHTKFEMDPFKLPIVEVNGDSWNIVQLSGVEMENETSVPAAPTYAGGVSENAVNVKNWTTRIRLSDNVINDVPRLRELVLQSVRRAYRQAKAEEIFDVISTSVTGASGIPEVLSGVSNALPSAANLLGRLAAMIAAVSTANRSSEMGMPKFWMSSPVYNLLLQATGSAEWAVRPSSDGGLSLWGYPLIKTDILDGWNGRGRSVMSVWCYRGLYRDRRRELTRVAKLFKERTVITAARDSGSV